MGSNFSRIHWGRFERLGKYALVMAAVLAAVGPAFVELSGYDSGYQRIWIPAFAKLLSQGVWIPRWLPDSFAGLGAPTFYYYPPLAYYLAAPFYLLSRSAEFTYWCVGLLALVASFFTARRYLDGIGAAKGGAMLGAAIFALAPFRLFEFYTRNGFGAHVGYAFVPLFFLALERLLRSDEHRAIHSLFLAILTAAIILTNVPLAFVCAIVTPIYVLARLPERSAGRLSYILVAALLGVGLAAYYLLPITELRTFAALDHLQLREQADRPRHRSGFFPDLNLTQLAQTLALRLGTILSLFASLWVMRRASYHRTHLSAPAVTARLVAALTIAVLLITLPIVTGPLWTMYPLSIIQFDFRFGPVELLMMGIVCSGLLGVESAKFRSVLVAFLGIASVGFALVLVLNLRVHGALPPVSPYDPPEYYPSALGGRTTAMTQFVRSHAPDPLILPSRSLEQNEAISLVERTPTSLFIRATLTDSCSVTLHQFRWPLWIVEVDGRPIPLSDTQRVLAGFSLPRGEHSVAVRLVRSPFERYGLYASVTSLVLLLLYVAVLGLREKWKGSTPEKLSPAT